MNDLALTAPPRPSDIFCNIAHYGSDLLTGGAYGLAGYEIGVGSLPIISGVMWTAGRALKIVDNTQCRFSGVLESVYGSIPELLLDITSIGLLANQYRLQKRADGTKLDKRSIRSLDGQIDAKKAELEKYKHQTSFSANTIAKAKAQARSMAKKNAAAETIRSTLEATISRLEKSKNALEQAPQLAKSAAQSAKRWVQGFSVVSEGAKIAIQEYVADKNYLFTFKECKAVCDALGVPYGKDVPYETTIKAYDDLVQSKVDEFNRNYLDKLNTLEDQVNGLRTEEEGLFKLPERMAPMPMYEQALALFLEKPSIEISVPAQNILSFLFIAKTHLKQNLNPSPTEGALYGAKWQVHTYQVQAIFDNLIGSINRLSLYTANESMIINEKKTLLEEIQNIRSLADQFISILTY